MGLHLVRQPVVTSSKNVYGYDLLCGGTPEYSVDLARERTVQSAAEGQRVSDFLTHFSDGFLSFVRIDRPQLELQEYKALPSDRFLLEIPETELPDRSLANTCREARRLGYRVVLKDFVVEPRLQPMLDCIDLLKVDFPALTNEQHRQIIEAASEHHFETIADHTRTPEEFDRARELGYQYFQGSFFCKPDLRNMHRLAMGQTQLLRVVQAVNQPEFSVDEIDQLIREDLNLSVRLLKYLNSSAFGLRSRVSSIRQAVAMLGHRPLQRWVTLLSVGELCQGKPLVLMSASLMRARFCDTIGERILSAREASECFLMGLLSLLDAILDQPMPRILGQLSLSGSIIRTLLGGTTRMASLLELIQCLEDGDFRRIAAIVYELQLDESFVFEEYRKACAWAADVFSGVQSHDQGHRQTAADCSS